MKLRLFVLLSCLYLALASREPPWGDAHVVYETTQALVDRGRLDVNLGGPPQFYVTRNKKKFGVFPLGNVIAMAPGWLAYKALVRVPGAPLDLVYRYTSHLSTSLLMAGVCVLFFAMARREGASERVAAWLALLVGTATILFVYARVPFSEALQTLALTWVVERTLAMGERLTGRGAFFTGVACGLLFNTKLVYALAFPVVALHVAVRHRRAPGRLLAAVAAAAPPLVLLCGIAVAHNYYKTGTLLDTGYKIPGGVFSGNAYAALYGFFLSPGKSIFLYSPPLLLAALALPEYLRTRRPRALFLVALVGALTLANAKFRYWHADYCWGPRLLVPLLPAMMLPVAPWIAPALARGRRRARAIGLGALVGVGLYAQLLGASFYWDHYIRIAIAVKDQTGAEGWYQEDLHHCHFIPQFSPLVGHAWLLRHTVLGDDDILADAPWQRVIATPVKLDAEWRAVKLDWWGADWFARAGAPIAGGGLAALLVTAGAWAAVGVRRRLRRAERPPSARGAVERA